MAHRSSPFHSIVNTLWDLTCCASIIGIWPRFVEPNRLSVTRLHLPIANLPKELEGFTLLQFSDLHLHPDVPLRFTDKVIQKIKDLQPDMILFTGDFLCYGELSAKERLQSLLKACSAPYGCFAIFGNHDYAQAVSFNDSGDYDILQKKPSAILKGLKRLFVNLAPTGRVTERARSVGLNPELVSLLKTTPFQLLDNETRCVPIKGSALNICGLGEYMLGRSLPAIAFQKYDQDFPGVILAHNPDCLPLLASYPGDIILSGHTHGGQVNLPWIWKKYTLLEDATYARGGLYPIDNRWLYVSRGLGSVLPFRWRSLPELVHITLETKR